MAFQLQNNFKIKNTKFVWGLDYFTTVANTNGSILNDGQMDTIMMVIGGMLMQIISMMILIVMIIKILMVMDGQILVIITHYLQFR